MSKAFPSVALACTFALALVACFPKSGPVPGPVSPEATQAAALKWPGTTQASLAEGRQLFSAHCSQCHGYPDVNAKSEGEWPGIVDDMAKKAKLDAAQKDKVLHFVLASRSQP